MRLLSLIATLLAASIAHAEPRGLVAVLPLAELGGLKLTPAQRDALDDAIRTHAAESLSARGYTVLTGENTLRVLEENGVDPTKACEASCALEAAQELKASYFISGNINFLDGLYIVTLRMNESTAGRVLSSVRLKAEKVVEATDEFTVKSDEFFEKGLTSSGESEVRATTVEKAPPPPEPENTLVESDSGPLTIFSKPAGASVYVDGTYAGNTPLQLPRVPAGQHLVEVRDDPNAYEVWRQEVTVEKDSGATISGVELTRRESDVVITSQPSGAVVTLDDVPIGQTSLKLRLLGGDYKLKVTKPGYAPELQTLHVRPPGPILRDVSLTPSGSGPGGRFTLKDLGLQYHAFPPKPLLLPTTRTVEEKELTVDHFRAGVLLGVPVGTTIATVIGRRMYPLMYEHEQVGNTGLSRSAFGVTVVGTALSVAIMTAVAYLSSDPTKVEVTDEDLVRRNQAALENWVKEKQAAETHNAEVDRQLRRANASIGADARSP